MTEGVVERHYLKCPFCPGRMDLDTKRCAVCGAQPVAILWGPPEAATPELVLVSRRYYVPRLANVRRALYPDT